MAVAYLGLRVGADGGQQVQHGEGGSRVDDRRVRQVRGGGVAQVVLQVHHGLDWDITGRAVVAMSEGVNRAVRTHSDTAELNSRRPGADLSQA